MPEGDTVWLVARRLHEALAGRLLIRCELRVPKLATTDLTGRRVAEVVPRGKHLLARIEGGWTLHSQLHMERPSGGAARRFTRCGWCWAPPSR